MRTLAALLLGVAVGVAATVAIAEIGGGRYTYVTLTRAECEAMPRQAEVVPHQPNPCHFRYPRWAILP